MERTDIGFPAPGNTADNAVHNGPANTIERIIGTIELLALAEVPLRLSDIAQRLDVPKSAMHRILASLAGRGWAEQTHAETYVLTLRMPLLGQRMLARLSLSDLRQPILDRLAAQTRELVRLTEVRGDALAWIGSARGGRAGLVYEPDMTEQIVPFATANGKAWLASLPPGRAAGIARKAGLGRRPDLVRAVATEDALQAELEATRTRGYGLSMQEAEEGVAAIAVTVGQGDGVVGTISVAAPVARLGDERIAEILPMLREAAASMLLAWRPQPAKA